MPEEQKEIDQQHSNDKTETVSEYLRQPLPDKASSIDNPQPVAENQQFKPEVSIDNTNETAAPIDTQVTQADPIPVVSNPFQQPEQPNVQPKKSSLPGWLNNKKLVIVIAVAVAVVMIGGGSALAYTSWYQNPKKILADSLINAVTAKTSIYEGDISVDGDGNKFTVEVTTKQAAATGSLDVKVTATLASKEYVINGGGKIDKAGDLYFMVGGLSDILVEAKNSAGLEADSPAASAIDKIVKKIDGVWVRVSSEDLKQFSVESSTAKTCINKTTEEFKTNRDAVSEVANIYRKNPFIVIKNELGQENGSFGYEVKGDNKALKSFAEGLKSTKIYKALYKCNKNFKIDTSNMDVTNAIDEAGSGTVEIWVGTWSHQITKIYTNSGNSSSKMSATIKPKYGQDIKITAPAKYISLSVLKTYINELIDTLGITENAQSSSSQSNAMSVQNIAEITYADNGYYPSRLSQFSQSSVSSLPSGIVLVADPSLINSSNGLNTISWQCLSTCANTEGGRIGYFDFNTNTVAWNYAGYAFEGDTFVNPTP